MNEVEKLYKLAKIEPFVKDEITVGRCCYVELKKVEILPQFTAEKQINLTQKLWKLKPNVYPNFDLLTNYSYGEMIAELVNHLWFDLTKEERQQIKEILR